MKQFIYKYGLTALGCVIMALGFNCFFVPQHLVSGGVSGIAMILYYITGLPIGLLSLAINVPLLYLAFRYLSREFLLLTFYGTTILSFAIDGTAFLTAQTYLANPLLGCIAGGGLVGTGCALIYMVGASTGGMDILGYWTMQKYSISVSTVNLVINLIIISCGIFLFGLEPALYSMIAFFISFKITNFLMAGFDYKKSFIIISDRAQEIGDEILKDVERGVTYLHGEGAYTNTKKQVIFAVVKLTQVNRVKEIIRRVDPYAFVILQDANEVFGRGFSMPRK